MNVPVVLEIEWSTLSRDEKRERVFAAADELFSREGVDISVPDVARAVGVGVGSLYRQVGKKEDLVAELIARRASSMGDRFTAAAAREDVGAALYEAVLETVDDCRRDRVLQEAWEASTHHPSVQAAHARLVAAMRTLVHRAQEASVFRDDATVNDLRLTFRGVASAEALEPGGARRLAVLVLAGLGAPR